MRLNRETDGKHRVRMPDWRGSGAKADGGQVLSVFPSVFVWSWVVLGLVLKIAERVSINVETPGPFPAGAYPGD